MTPFGCLAALQQLGLDCLMRLHQARSVDWQRGKRLGKADRQLQWAKPKRCPRTLSAEQFAALPDTLTVRLLRIKATLKGFRTRNLVLVTTLLDPVAYPAEALATLYLQRWAVELHFRELKTLMRLDVLRCRSPQMIRKGLLMHFIAYNLVRAAWAPVGQQASVAISGQNAQGNLYCALNLRSGRRATLKRPHQRQGNFQAFLRRLRHGRGAHDPLYLLVDSHSSHKARASLQLARELKVILLWLPKQCPRLNPVEHLWRALKADVAANRQFASIEETLRYAETWTQRLSPQQAFRKAGLLSPKYWLHKLYKNF